MMHEIFREKYLYSKISQRSYVTNGFRVQNTSGTTTQQHYVLSHTTSKPSATSTM